MVLNVTSDLTTEKLLKAFEHMHLAKALYDVWKAEDFENQVAWFPARGHEAFQTALGYLLQSGDTFYPSLRDWNSLSAMGVPQEELIKQVYGQSSQLFHGLPSYPGLNAINHPDYPRIPAQTFDFKGSPSQACGFALAIKKGLVDKAGIVVCSLSDGAETAGGFLESLEFAAKEKLPLLFVVQDNEWIGGSPSEDVRLSDAMYMTRGFRSIRREEVHGGDFVQSYDSLFEAMNYVREEQMPMLVLGKCPLIGDYSSKIAQDLYRSSEDLESHSGLEPLERIKKYLTIEGKDQDYFASVENKAQEQAKQWITQAKNPSNGLAKQELPPLGPTAGEVPTGASSSENESYKELTAKGINELLAKDDTIYIGQNMARPMGGYLMQSNGVGDGPEDEKVLNMAYAESLMSGLFCGLAQAGAFPIIEMDSATSMEQVMALLEGINELMAIEGKAMRGLLRLLEGCPPGYGPGGNYLAANAFSSLPHSYLLTPSNGAMAYGLIKSAYQAQYPVVLLEDNLLRDAQESMSQPLDATETYPIGKVNVIRDATESVMEEGASLALLTYGLSVPLALKASESLGNPAEVIDLGTLNPLDMDRIVEAVKRHSKLLIVGGGPGNLGYVQSLAGRISREAFQYLDGPVEFLNYDGDLGIPVHADEHSPSVVSSKRIEDAIKSILAY